MKPPAVVICVLAALIAVTCVAPHHAQRVIGFGLTGGGPVTSVSDIAPTDILRISLIRTACYGSCPDDTVTFSRDERAQYRGGIDAPRSGFFVGLVDSGTLFAALAASGVESLSSSQKPYVIDAPSIIVLIEREHADPLRFVAQSIRDFDAQVAAAALMIEGAESQVRWLRDDGRTPWFGAYGGTAGEFGVMPMRTGVGVVMYGSASLCMQPDRLEPIGTTGLRIVCGGKRSEIHRNGADIIVTGSAIRPGTYHAIARASMFPRRK